MNTGPQRRKEFRPMCPSCGSFEVRYRSKSGTFICRRCGQVFGGKGSLKHRIRKGRNET